MWSVFVFVVLWMFVLHYVFCIKCLWGGSWRGDSLVFSLSPCQVAVMNIVTVFIEFIFTWSIKNWWLILRVSYSFSTFWNHDCVLIYTISIQYLIKLCLLLECVIQRTFLQDLHTSLLQLHLTCYYNSSLPPSSSGVRWIFQWGGFQWRHIVMTKKYYITITVV